ncbi:MAG TPA: metallophosphoesterase [Planctomycetota bacterium]|nr:metallophosphoesterase [Planctomycetota bacterium]
MRAGWSILLVGLLACAREADPPPVRAPGPGAPRDAAPVASPPRPESPRAVPVPVPALDFAAYGDCRSNHEIHRGICAALIRAKPKFVVVSGDLVDWGESPDDWRIFREVTGELRAGCTYLAAPGNHDVSADRLFEREFGLERIYYDRRVGDVHLFLLDSNDYFRDPEQLRWLEETARASDARHKIAVFHHPPFSIEPWGDFEQKPVRERLHPLLVRLRFCAAFCGHHHAFYATKRDGVRYVVTAGGGAVLYPLDEKLAQPGDVFRRFHHFVGCTRGEKGISARVFDESGREAPDLAFPLCEHP